MQKGKGEKCMVPLRVNENGRVGDRIDKTETQHCIYGREKKSRLVGFVY
jgi:hypothetical protein